MARHAPKNCARNGHGPTQGDPTLRRRSLASFRPGGHNWSKGAKPARKLEWRITFVSEPNTCASVCEAVTSLLEVQRYRVVIHCDPVNASMAIAQIKGEWLRWNLCEAQPPPSYCQRVTWSSLAGWNKPQTFYLEPQQFYFICETCQCNNPRWRGYTNINVEGAQSTATSDQSMASSDSEFP